MSRQGAEGDELLEAIMGYGTRRDTARARTARDEEIMRAILGGGRWRRALTRAERGRPRYLGNILGGVGNLAISASFGGDTIANPLELKFGADPWRGLRSTGDKSFAKQIRLGSPFGGR